MHWRPGGFYEAFVKQVTARGDALLKHIARYGVEEDSLVVDGNVFRHWVSSRGRRVPGAPVRERG